MKANQNTTNLNHVELSDDELDAAVGGSTTTAGGGVTKSKAMDYVYYIAYKMFWY